METGPVQVEPLAGVFAVTWVSLGKEQWRKWRLYIHSKGEFMKQPAVISPPLAIYNSAFLTQTEGRGGSKKTIQR